MPNFPPPPSVDVSKFASKVELMPYRLEGSKFKFRGSRCGGKPVPPGLITQETKETVRWKRTSGEYGYQPESVLRPRASDRGRYYGLNGAFTDHMVRVGFGRSSNFMKVSKPSHVVWGRESNMQGTAAWDTYRKH